MTKLTQALLAKLKTIRHNIGKPPSIITIDGAAHILFFSDGRLTEGELRAMGFVPRRVNGQKVWVMK